jgi:hypothetical protein
MSFFLLKLLCFQSQEWLMWLKSTFFIQILNITTNRSVNSVDNHAITIEHGMNSLELLIKGN